MYYYTAAHLTLALQMKVIEIVLAITHMYMDYYDSCINNSMYAEFVVASR